MKVTLRTTTNGVDSWSLVAPDKAMSTSTWTFLKGTIQTGGLVGVSNLLVYFNCNDTDLAYAVDDIILRQVTGPSQSNTVDVFDEFGQPLSGAAVSVVLQDSGETFAGSTGSTGEFTFTSSPGDCAVTVTHGGREISVEATTDSDLNRIPVEMPVAAARWEFDDSNFPTLDTSAGENDLVSVPSGSWSTAGHRVGVLDLAGTSMATIPDAFKTAYSQRTVAFWFKADTMNSANLLDLGGTNGGMGIRITSANRLQARIRTSSTVEKLIATDFSDTSSWHHAVLVFDSGTMRFYLDGNLLGTQTLGASTVPAITSALVLGGRSGGDVFTTGSGVYLDGKLDDVRIYDAALTDYQVADVFKDGQLRVVAYLPAYRIPNCPQSRFANVSHVIYHSFSPDPDTGTVRLVREDGQFPYSATIETYLGEIRATFGVKIMASIFGSQSAFGPIAASATKRATFIQDMIAICQAENFDGFDIDWEYPETAADKVNFATLLAEMRTAFDAEGLLVTAALTTMSNNFSTQYPKSMLNHSLDWVNAMAYDDNWLQPGKHHSDLSTATKAIERFISAGGQPGQVALGIPFYGKSYNADGTFTAIRYSDLVTTYAPASSENWAGPFSFNGPDLVREKIDLGISWRIAGFMIWEMAQDNDLSSSLLDAMTDQTDDTPE